MDKIYNFSQVASSLPDEVMKKFNEALVSYSDTGISLMDINSNSPEFKQIMDDATSSLKELMQIPDNYRILFLQGGATTQFATVPLNLLSEHKCADYIVSGQYSRRAYLEAKKYGDIAIAASSAGASPTFSVVPEVTSSHIRPDADYVHMCYNNTIYGTKFNAIPETGSIPLVADMSSCILSEPYDVSKFALIYASAQKNISIAGLTVVIIREDIIGGCRADAPDMLNYKVLADSKSTYNTPPVWSIYIAMLTFRWLLSLGGLDEMKRRNERKASLLYDYLDSQQKFFTSPVDRNCRSMTNVLFFTGDAELDRRFCQEAAKEGLINLKGHVSVGGLCASLYNSMPYEGVEKLVAFMKKFAAENPKL